jgi:hypothetical protein
MKRILLFLLSLILLAGTVTACSSPAKPLEITQEEALAVLKDLVPKSYELNVIFFGEGLPLTDVPEEKPSSLFYCPVSEESPYTKISQVKAAAEKVYSARYLSGVYVGAFEGVIAESTDGLLDTNLSPRYKEYGGKLHGDVMADVKDIRGRLEVISATVGRCTPEYVSTRVTCREEDGDTTEITVLLTLENGVWLLDSPTY